MFSHIEKDHSEFLSNLKTLFLPAKKRMDQFMTSATENFELEVPSWEQVEKLHRQEKINKKLEKAKKDGAEIKKKKRMQKKMVLKRKQDEKDKIKST